MLFNTGSGYGVISVATSYKNVPKALAELITSLLERMGYEVVSIAIAKGMLVITYVIQHTMLTTSIDNITTRYRLNHAPCLVLSMVAYVVVQLLRNVFSILEGMLLIMYSTMYCTTNSTPNYSIHYNGSIIRCNGGKYILSLHSIGIRHK